jgi:hypothetical protein
VLLNRQSFWNLKKPTTALLVSFCWEGHCTPRLRLPWPTWISALPVWFTLVHPTDMIYTCPPYRYDLHLSVLPIWFTLIRPTVMIYTCPEHLRGGVIPWISNFTEQTSPVFNKTSRMVILATTVATVHNLIPISMKSCIFTSFCANSFATHFLTRWTIRTHLTCNHGKAIPV